MNAKRFTKADSQSRGKRCLSKQPTFRHATTGSTTGLYGEKLARPEGWVTLLSKKGQPFWPSQLLVSKILKGNVGKVGSPRAARVGEWTFYPRKRDLKLTHDEKIINIKGYHLADDHRHNIVARNIWRYCQSTCKSCIAITVNQLQKCWDTPTKKRPFSLLKYRC